MEHNAANNLKSN